MSKSSLRNGAGPGSSISLAPETIRIRNALIEKFSGSTLDEMNSFMTMALSTETDELRRLGILAARIFLLRNRIDNLKEFNRNPSLNSPEPINTNTLSLRLPVDEEASDTTDAPPTETESWSRIQMIEPGEVSGVRFLAGTIIDAQDQDANKLIRSGKAVRVDEEGNVITHHDDDFSDAEPTATPAESTAIASLSEDDQSTDVEQADIAEERESDNDPAAAQEPDLATEIEVEVEADADVDAGAEVEADAGAEVEPDADAGAEVEADAGAEVEVEAAVEPKSEADDNNNSSAPSK